MKTNFIEKGYHNPATVIQKITAAQEINTIKDFSFATNF